jgi:cyclopropane fatty-acyl-phospholipid synthase-like methyltransferase
MTADELRLLINWLGLDEGSRVLDVACGSGGPSLFIAQSTGARVTGVDVNEAAIATAAQAARERALEARADPQLARGGVHVAQPLTAI